MYYLENFDVPIARVIKYFVPEITDCQLNKNTTKVGTTQSGLPLSNTEMLVQDLAILL